MQGTIAFAAATATAQIDHKNAKQTSFGHCSAVAAANRIAWTVIELFECEQAARLAQLALHHPTITATTHDEDVHTKLKQTYIFEQILT